MFNRSLSLGSAANLCRRLGTGLKAGVDLLRLLQSEMKHGPAAQRAVMGDVHQAIRDGETFPDALRKQGSYFPPLLLAMASAGDAAGKLDSTLLALADFFEQRLRLRRSFLRQISWPMFQLVAAILIVGLLIYILGVLRPPTGGEMFDPTGFGLRGAGGVVRYFGYVALAGLLIGGSIWAFLNNVAGVHNLIPILYRIPVAGRALQTITLSRFTWTLALSLEAGIDPIRAIQLGLDATASDFYRSGKEDVVLAIRGGKTMSEALDATGIFPSDFLSEIEIAELSGTDAEALQHLAAQYDERATRAMETLATIASRVIGLAVMVLMVGLILRMAMRIMGGIQDALQPI
ncbi:MAG: general secretion pathway protein GspF [Planctomycetaceae bacterium]|nr:MAG: general secretion pathway protein GspF [Planctomycetaceae bacterium]